MITKKMLCFDMDGTIADLYAVPNWLEKLRKGDPSPFQDAAPMWNMKALRNALDEINKAIAARQTAADTARRDPAGVLRDDDGWRRD